MIYINSYGKFFFICSRLFFLPWQGPRYVKTACLRYWNFDNKISAAEGNRLLVS